MNSHIKRGACIACIWLLSFASCRDWKNPKDHGNPPEEHLPFQGLVAYYPFNGNATDESGNGNNGSIHGAVLSVDRFGTSSRAFSFDGVDDYIEAGDSDDLDITDQITMCVWIYQNSANIDGSRIIDKSTRARSDGYLLDTYDGTSGRRIRFESLTRHICKSLYSLNKWHFIAVTWDGATVKMYLDGMLDESYVKADRINVNNLTLRIGAPHNEGSGAFSTLFFNGMIDDVRIYNRSLTDLEISQLHREGGYVSPLDTPTLTANGVSSSNIRIFWRTVSEATSYILETSKDNTGPYNVLYSGADTSFTHSGLQKAQRFWYRLKANNPLTSSAWSEIVSAVTFEIPADGLLAYYPFNGNANDESRNSKHATTNGATLTADRSNQPNSAYFFNGSNNYLIAPSQSMNNFTLLAWINRASAPGSWHSIVSKRWGSGDDNSIYLACKDNKYTLYIHTSSGIGWLTGTAAVTNQWINIAGLYDGLKMQLYVNGILNASASFSGTLLIDNNSFIIGADNNGTIGEFHHGTLR